MYTVEPLNNGHVLDYLIFIERLSSLRRLKCTSIIEKEPIAYPLFGVSIIRGSTVHCEHLYRQ